MHAKLYVGALCILAMLCGWAVYAQTHSSAPSAGEPVYLVASWPAHKQPETPYRKEVEEFLNEMAGDGWRLHSVVAAQKESMMVFERASRR